MIGIVFFVLLSLVYSQNVYISQVMVDNRSIPDEKGNFPSFLVITNPTSADVSLGRFNLSCSSVSLSVFSWKFPDSALLLPLATLTVYASGSSMLPTNAPFHTNFILPKIGSLSLVDSNSKAVISALTWVDQLPDIAYGVTSFGGVPVYLTTPTSVGITSNPILSDERDWYTAPVTITMTSDVASVVRYTIDGSDPTTSGLVYAQGSNFSISVSTVVKVFACRSNYICSPIKTHSFLFLTDIISQFPVSTITSTQITNSLRNLPTLSITSSRNLDYSTLSSEQSADYEFIYPLQDYDNLFASGGISREGNEIKPSFNIKFGGTYTNVSLLADVFISNVSSSITDFNLMGSGSSYKLLGFDSRNYASSSNGFVSASLGRWSNLLSESSGGYAQRGQYMHVFWNLRYIGLYCFVQAIDNTYLQDLLGNSEDGSSAWNIENMWNTDPTQIPTSLASILNVTDIYNSSFVSNVQYRKISRILNLTDFTDFLLKEFLLGSSNMANPTTFIVSNKINSSGLLPYFMRSDSEIVLNGNVPAYIFSFDSSSVIAGTVSSLFQNFNQSSKSPWLPKLFSLLRTNPLYSILVADRIESLFVDSNDVLAPLSDTSMVNSFASVSKLLSQAVYAEASRWNGNVNSWNSDVAAVEILLSNLNEKMLLALKSFGFISKLPVPQILNQLTISPGVVNSSFCQDTPQGYNTTIHFTLATNSNFFSSNGTVLASVYMYTSLGIFVCNEDIIDSVVTVSSRSFHSGFDEFGTWSALARRSLKYNPVTSSSPFVYFATARQFLTLDTDSLGNVIYSALISINVAFPTKQLTLVLAYSSLNATTSTLSFSAVNAQLPIIILPVSGVFAVYVAIPVGLTSFDLVVYSSSPILSDHVVQISVAPSTNLFIVDSRSFFHLNKYDLNQVTTTEKLINFNSSTAALTTITPTIFVTPPIFAGSNSSIGPFISSFPNHGLISVALVIFCSLLFNII